MMGKYVEEWNHLAGLMVCVRKGGVVIRIGQVETVTPDGAVLWLRSEGVEPRALFQKAEGYTAWTVSYTESYAPIDHFRLDETLCWPTGNSAAHSRSNNRTRQIEGTK